MVILVVLGIHLVNEEVTVLLLQCWVEVCSVTAKTGSLEHTAVNVKTDIIQTMNTAQNATVRTTSGLVLTESAIIMVCRFPYTLFFECFCISR